MRKIFCLVLAFVFTLSLAATAAEVSIKDAGKDIITVKGDAPKGETVTIAILNPGYDVSDVAVSSSGEMALQYYGKTIAGDNGFELDVRMTDPHDLGGGEYKLVYSDKNSSHTSAPTPDTFNFYFNGKKIEEIANLNEYLDYLNGEEPGSGQEIEVNIAELYKTYTLDKHELISLVKEDSLEKILYLEAEYEEDVDKMYEALVEALCIAGYTEGVSEIVKDGYLSYTDIVKIEEEDAYTDYCLNINEAGVKAVNDSVLGGDYKNTADIRKAFAESAVLNLITNNKKMGYGHVSEVFSKYDDLLLESGIDTELIKKVKNKNYVYGKLASSTDKNLTALKKTYKNALEDADKPSGGGGGGGGGTTITAPADGAMPPVVSPNPNGGGYVENTVVPFTDMTLAPWANDSVAYLYRRGIVSGKSANLFDPSSTVTREEFAKMAVLAFVGRADVSSCDFEDVSGWSVPYVATAVSKGIVSGLSDVLFGPRENITREQAATIIARAMESAGFVFEKEAKEFEDNDTVSDWAKEKVGLLASEEIISGRGNDLFCPAESMTRAEAAKLIYEAIKRTGGAN